ncbi:MAG: ABC transporter substrate-binding protein, partial [Clostridia bacterium]|nr:ABC transporter substrate-binding protein [Clostridia bacterium]
DAAGQLIENVTKSILRKETVDEEYYDKLYDSVSSLYRLDQLNLSAGTGKKTSSEMGGLPAGSVILICAIVSVWTVLIIYTAVTKIKEKNKRK